MNKVKIILFISCFIFSITHGYCQIDSDWIMHIDHQNRGEDEGFWDIFATMDGGYALCGDSRSNGRNDMWLVKLSRDGELQWSQLYGERGHDHAASLIQDDDGGYVVAGSITNDENNKDIAVFRTDAQGDTLWIRNYGTARNDGASAVIELKSGEFMLCGSYYNEENNSIDGCLLQINGDGRLLWLQTYGRQGSQSLTAMRETEGGIVASGYERDGGNSSHYIIKTDFDGELLWEHYYEPHENEEIAQSGMNSCDAGGFILTGRMLVNRQTSRAFLLRFDSDGNRLWSRRYEINPGDPPYGNCGSYNVVEQGDGGLIMACNGTGGYNALLIRTDCQGNEVWRHSENYGEIDRNCRFRSLVINIGGQVTAAGAAEYQDTGADGLVVKFRTEEMNRLIQNYTPDDLDFSILPDENVEFTVEAEQVIDAPLIYLWYLNEDSLDAQDRIELDFNELGQQLVKCQVVNGGFADSVNWEVNVSEMYIENYVPETCEISIRRRSAIDFSLNAIAVENHNIEYLWTLTGRNNNREEIGESDSVTILFDQAGEHEVNALVTCGESSEEIEWLVHVRSAIWSWLPEELHFETYKDSIVEFSVFPFNPDSDSLEFRWMVDGAEYAVDTSTIAFDFPDLGEREIVAYVQDGVESDTVSWLIEVQERSFADFAVDADMPAAPMLYPAYPNPFNAVTTLKFYLPVADRIKLSVFDIYGREVSRLVDGQVNSGWQSVTWDANGVLAGVYLVRMNDLVQKVVLVR